jgi:hypothetical protein
VADLTLTTQQPLQFELGLHVSTSSGYPCRLA